MSENTKLPEEKQKRSKWFKILAAAVPALLLVVAVPKIMYNTSDNGDTSISDDYTPDVPERDPNADEYVDRQEKAPESDGIAVPGWNTLNIPKNTKEVMVDFYNPEENEGRYQMTFELRLPDKSNQGYEVLYKSGLVDPGLHIQNITLSHELDKGIYDATIHVQPYRMDEQKTATNNADLQTQLIVE